MKELDTSCEQDGHQLFLVFLVPCERIVNKIGMNFVGQMSFCK